MKVDYKFYATLLDSFQYYLKSDREEAFQELIDKVNRVPFVSEAADKGTAFNELVDTIAESGERPADVDGLYYHGRFTFKADLVNHFVSLYQNALPQVFTKATLTTKKGVVELYGYIDEVLPGEVHDIKCTGSYSFPKFLHAWQKVVYPFCLAQNGIDCPDFTYMITDYSSVYREDYRYRPDRDLPTLTLFCEELIDFLETNRHLITDKKVFGGDNASANEPVTAVLTEDVYSHFVKKGAKETEAYGRKGDQVTLVEDRGDVLLVKSSKGEIFPIGKSKTQTDVTSN